MNQTLNPFEKLLVELVKNKVEFITVGGLACVMNGHVRATEDVDILVKSTTSNLQRLIGFLAQYGEGFGAELKESDFNDEEGAIRVIEEFPIDIFTVMGGHDYEELQQYKKTVVIEGYRVPFLSASGLILLKQNSVREKDKMDVFHLRNLKDQK